MLASKSMRLLLYSSPSVRFGKCGYSNSGYRKCGELVILGASGPTGMELVKEALEQGFRVKALVRKPDKIQMKSTNLKVEKVNIFRTEELAVQLRGSDAVLSCLGARASVLSHQTCTLYSHSASCVTQAMYSAGVTRLVCVSAWCTTYTPGSPKFIEWLSRPLYLGNILSDMWSMEEQLRQNNHINYTVVRAPGLSYGPSTDKPIKAKEGQYLKHVSLTMPRRDVAKFMLSVLDTPVWDRKCVAIGI